MPSTYRVEEIVEQEDWTGDYGPMTSYKVRLEGVEGTVALNQKQSTPPPSGEITGEIGTDKRGNPRFKKAQAQGNFGGGARSPEEKKRIERMAAHKTAAHLLEVAWAMGLIDKGSVQSSEGLMKAHKGLTDRLVADLP